MTGWRDTLTFKGAYSESQTAPAHARTTRTDCRPRLSRSCSLPPSCCLGRCLGCRLGHCKQGARSARTCVLALILLLRALPHMPSHAPCMCTYSPPRVRLSLVRRPQAAATGRRLRLCHHRRRRSSLVLDVRTGRSHQAPRGGATHGRVRQGLGFNLSKEGKTSAIRNIQRRALDVGETPCPEGSSGHVVPVATPHRLTS